MNLGYKLCFPTAREINSNIYANFGKPNIEILGKAALQLN